jgi:2-polyprenyl-6-methoxyphenol hydroxylase-like FAD-dependent oxidoreductase
LNDTLPDRVRELFVANALVPSAGVQALTERLEPLAAQPPGAMSGSNPIVRSTLRRVLLTGLDEVVEYNRTFSRFDHQPDGTVRATFQDGSVADGDVLVGADGVGSKVRAQLLPGARVVDTGLIGMAGKLPITDRSRSYLSHGLLGWLTSIRASDGHYMIITQSIHKHAISPDVRPSRVVMVDPAEDESDHSIWVLVSPRDVYGPEPRSMLHDGAALQKLALRQMGHWDARLQRMVADTDPRQISATTLRGAEPVEPWNTTNVTLLGDAIHAMPPLRGLGGSTTLRDAALLTGKLSAVERGEASVKSAIRDYELSMLEYGFAAVKSSLEMARMIAAGPLGVSSGLDPRKSGGHVHDPQISAGLPHRSDSHVAD